MSFIKSGRKHFSPCILLTVDLKSDIVASLINSKISLNTTNKMSVCLRDGEIILRIVAYLLISNDESVLQKSCLKDLKNTYLALGVPLRNARRVFKLMQNATISDLKSTVKNKKGNNAFLPNLISETEFQFERIINLLN